MRRSIPGALSRAYTQVLSVDLSAISVRRSRCKVERSGEHDISSTAIALLRTNWISNFQHFSIPRAFKTLILSISLFLSLSPPSLSFLIFSSLLSRSRCSLVLAALFIGQARMIAAQNRCDKLDDDEVIISPFRNTSGRVQCEIYCQIFSS